MWSDAWGIPLWVGGGGGGHGSPLLSHNPFVGVVGGNILNGEHLNKIVGVLAGDSSGGGKAKGGGLRISATLFFHKHVICLQRIVVCQGRTTKKLLDKAIPAATNGDYPSRICPPVGRRGWPERGSHMLLQRGTIAADGRHARTVLHLSDAPDYFSDNLCTLQGDLASYQITQASPPHKCLGGNNKDDDR